MSEVFEKAVCEEASVAGAGYDREEHRKGHAQGLIIETPRPRGSMNKLKRVLELGWKYYMFIFSNL